MSEASPEWITALQGHWKLYGKHAKNGEIFIWMNVCVLFHMTQLIFRSKKKTTVEDQINTDSKTNKHRTRRSKITDENACLCTQKSGSNWNEGIWSGKIWCGLFIYYSFISPNFFKPGRRLFVSCAPATQHKHVLPSQHNICYKQSP